jgi:chlorobactene glucosyltransferase
VVRCFPGQSVIVVDDASTDGTAQIALDAGARVISAPPLPPKAAGKPNACLAGARAARTKWLLFVDADTRFSPDFAGSIVAYAEQHDLTLCSAFLHQTCLTWAERAVLPYAFALYFTGVRASAVNSPDSSEALANGQAMLFRRDAYEQIGGHAVVLDSIVEDVALAAAVKRARLRNRVVRAEHLGSVRMYESLTDLWRGFEKNSFRFLTLNPRTGVQVVLASVLMTSYLPLLAALVSTQSWWMAAAATLAPVFLLRSWYGSTLRAVWSPLAIYLFQAIAITAMLGPLVGRKTMWKERPV